MIVDLRSDLDSAIRPVTCLMGHGVAGPSGGN
jgi:hypothetical protein